MNFTFKKLLEVWAAGCGSILAASALAAKPAAPPAPAPRDEMPWLNPSRTPDERAALALAAMTLEEKLGLLHGPMPQPVDGKMPDSVPAEAIPGAGYIPGVPRLHLPALFETDASLGVTNPGGVRPDDVATALPSSLALAATFSPDMAYRTGALLGAEARSKGFNVLLAGGMNLARDPRNGRNFEYLGEDPLLAGDLAAASVRGIQAQHVISTVKHFALNANETRRNDLDARIDRGALRESDLLAFQLALERGAPGAVMCAYNKVNADHACGNDWLLNTVLKGNWRYPGWVMSDWGAVHGVGDLLHGLDQQSGEQLDREIWFGKPLAEAVATHEVPLARVDDAVRRILRSEFAIGLVDHPPAKASIDYLAHAQWALQVAQAGSVLLKNDAHLLPFPAGLRRIAVIGGQANKGVLSGAGSSQVTASNGPWVKVRVMVNGEGYNSYYFPSVPLQAIHAAAPGAAVVFNSGTSPGDAAKMAAGSDAAIVFVTRWQNEGLDSPNMRLPDNQDALVAAVAAANPNTAVVLETGNPVEMPWIDQVGAVLAAWFPGQEGARAIADILFGRVNPSGHLPVSFPRAESDLVRPQLPNLGIAAAAPASVDYTEGADVGYRGYARRDTPPLYPFGHGLSYTSFAYEQLRVTGGKAVSVTFEVINSGPFPGADVPQLYLTADPAGPQLRLLGYQRVELSPGERRRVQLTVDRRLLGHYDETRQRWRVAAGRYELRLGKSAGQLLDSGAAQLNGAEFAD